MNFNQPPKNNNEAVPEEKKRETASLFLLGAETMVGSYINKLNVTGKENLELIPKGKKVVIAASHISDLDMPIIIKTLGKDFNIKVTGQSVNKETSAGKVSRAILGSSHYIPIDYEMKDGKKVPKFNPDNFTEMTQAFDAGADILVAAHSPAWGHLPEGGIGAVYLNQLTEDCVILPVTVNVKSTEPFRDGVNRLKIMKERPDADVVIGKPLSFEHIPNISEYKNILDKRKKGENLDNTERELFVEISKKLREQSDAVMRTIASALPPEKRGTYI